MDDAEKFATKVVFGEEAVILGDLKIIAMAELAM